MSRAPCTFRQRRPRHAGTPAEDALMRLFAYLLALPVIGMAFLLATGLMEI